MDNKQKIDVLVIGAGAAGLMAWRELHSANFRVVLLEARPRLGGRILTDYSTSSPIKLGAEAVGSLGRIFAKSAGWLHDRVDKIYYHDWSNDPFCRGAYSYPKVGGLQAAETLSKPVDNTIFFAGKGPTFEELLARCKRLLIAEFRRLKLLQESLADYGRLTKQESSTLWTN